MPVHNIDTSTGKLGRQRFGGKRFVERFVK